VNQSIAYGGSLWIATSSEDVNRSILDRSNLLDKFQLDATACAHHQINCSDKEHLLLRNQGFDKQRTRALVRFQAPPAASPTPGRGRDLRQSPTLFADTSPGKSSAKMRSFLSASRHIQEQSTLSNTVRNKPLTKLEDTAYQNSFIPSAHKV
jgi:hypothetical protein